jgi:hypothetical protein
MCMCVCLSRVWLHGWSLEKKIKLTLTITILETIFWFRQSLKTYPETNETNYHHYLILLLLMRSSSSFFLPLVLSGSTVVPRWGVGPLLVPIVNRGRVGDVGWGFTAYLFILYSCDVFWSFVPVFVRESMPIAVMKRERCSVPWGTNRTCWCSSVRGSFCWSSKIPVAWLGQC